MAQFDVYRHPDFHGLILDTQHDLHRDLKSRVIIPLVPEGYLRDWFPGLNPIFEMDEMRVVLAPQFIATISAGTTGRFVVSLENERDRIISALDFLFTGF